MAYQSLYRRYRPRRFSDVRDQEQVVRALRNAVREDRVGHAYLFSGPRGTGKTSTARILAKALNCEDLQDGEPCGVCDSCVAIDNGTSYNVQELDAASNRGVDDVRDLIGRVALGSPGRTKVYILDEVHMLTKEASAALLKTLEEPPDHVVFVLATTDPHKVLPTIRSRTQHHEFRLLNADDLAEHVRWVIHDAGLELPDDAVDYVVRQGGGSARDTLSALERVAAAGGVGDEGEALDDLIDAVAERDTAKALRAVAEAVTSGRDPRVLGEALLARLRDVFLLRMGAAVGHLTADELSRTRAWADQLSAPATTRALELVGEALLEMRQAPDPRIPLEVALVKLTRPEADATLDALAARVAQLEAALAGGTPIPPTSPAPAATSAGSPAPAASAPKPSAPPAASTPAPASAPAAPAGPGGGRPADRVRAKLAEQRAERSAKTGAPPARAASRSAAAPASAPSTAPPPAAPPPSSPPPGPAAAPDVPPADEVAPPDAAAAPAVEPSTPAVEPPAAAAASATSGSADWTTRWNDEVLPKLGGLARAMYSTAQLASVDGSVATVQVENEHHRDNCERKRADVERVLGEVLSQPTTVRLEVGGAASGGPVPSATSAKAAAPISDDPDEHLAGGDVHDLDDAPDAPTGGLAALTEAFPGAELVDPS